MATQTLGVRGINRVRVTGPKNATLAATLSAIETAVKAQLDGTDNTHVRYVVDITVKPMQI